MVVIKENISLAPFTAFRIGGPARFLTVAKSVSQLKEALAFAQAKGLSVFILGGGSNILLPDEGFGGLVIRMRMNNMQWSSAGRVVADAGCAWDSVVRQAVSRGLAGIENLSLIPGTVGGAVYQNIGAYGVELKDVVRRVQVLDARTGKVRWFSKNECQFGYRASMFKNPRPFKNDAYAPFLNGPRLIVLVAELALSKKFIPNIRYPDLARHFKSRTPTLIAVRRTVIRVRRRKLVYPSGPIGSAGSFFENPIISQRVLAKILKQHPDVRYHSVGDSMVKLSAGQLIELAGFKGRRLGKVGVSDKHALVLVNYGGGTAKQIQELAKQVISGVKARFGVILRPEVQQV